MSKSATGSTIFQRNNLWSSFERIKKSFPLVYKVLTFPENLAFLKIESYGFSSSHVSMWELDQKESWVPKNGCFWTVVLEKTLESPLESKEIKPVNSKGNQPWLFIGRTDAEAEAPVLWPLMWTANSLGKTLMLGKIEGKKRRQWQRMRQLDSIINTMDLNLSKL